jgi:deazaflavin-dependent oxidoreductase (nitroreductase family)
VALAGDGLPVALDPALARRSVCNLETIGRRTGQPRRIEIWFAADPAAPRIYMLSGGRDDAHWVLNLRGHPTVRVRIEDRWFDGRAREIPPGPEDLHARELVAAKYEGWRAGRQMSAWARESLPIAVDLVLDGIEATDRRAEPDRRARGEGVEGGRQGRPGRQAIRTRGIRHEGPCVTPRGCRRTLVHEGLGT